MDEPKTTVDVDEQSKTPDLHRQLLVAEKRLEDLKVQKGAGYRTTITDSGIEQGLNAAIREAQEEVERITLALPSAEVKAEPDPDAHYPPDDEEPDDSDGYWPPADHPLTPVAGRYAYIDELLKLKLPEGGDLFSNGARSLLHRACAVPEDSSKEGYPLVGVESLLRAALAMGAMEYSSSPPGQSFDGAIVEYVAGSDATGDILFVFTDMAPISTDQVEIGESVATQEVTRVVWWAVYAVLKMSPNQERIDLRHLLISLLASKEGQRACYDLGLVRGDPAAFFGELFVALTKYLHVQIDSDVTRGEPADSFQGMEEMMGLLRFRPEAVPESRRRSEIYYSADAPGSGLEDDLLGAADDVRALAEVVCLREPGPPLAIGLFGDWGSGKSTFMNMLEDAIGKLTRAARETPELPFVGNVVPIKFNAWHYSDASLWASLTSEFFGQLRVGGYGGKSDELYGNLVAEVTDGVAQAEGEATVQAGLALEAHGKAMAASQEIKALERKLENAPIDALATAAKIYVTRTRQGKRALQSMGLGRKSEEEAVAAVEEALTIVGKLATLWRPIKARPFSLLHGFALLLFGVSVLWAMGFLDSWLGLPRDWLALLSGLIALAAPLVSAYGKVKPILQAATAYKGSLEKRHRDIESRLSKQRALLSKQEALISDAEAKRAKSEAEAARFRGQGPAEVLDFFLNRSLDANSFEQDLGVVSRVRRTFEQLDAILEKQKKAENDGRQEAKGAERQLPDIDRIVLYIDDLDRCRVEQVVAVLEAVHLLLAFPLFVVVVGVDPRWLENSLLQVYRSQLRRSDEAPAVEDAADGAAERATVHDYLEKIFQIPLRLRPLSSGEDGSFARLIADSVGPVQAAVEPPGEDRVETRESDTEESTSDAPPPGEEVTPQIAPVEVTLQARKENPQGTVERITLRQEEVDLMTALGPLAGNSPRAAKRFVNLYRLVRGTRRDGDLADFLDGKPPLYPAVLLWLAVDTGASSDVLLGLRQAVRAPGGTEDLWSDLQAALASGGDPARKAALAALEEALPEEEGRDRVLQALELTERFSFAEA